MCMPSEGRSWASEQLGQEQFSLLISTLMALALPFFYRGSPMTVMRPLTGCLKRVYWGLQGQDLAVI